jgi:CRP/FNR family cyclic AMP-dependent transcriptional regulator
MVNPLWGNIFRRKAEEESLAGFLGTVQVFSELKGRELNFLETLVHVRRYSPQETVFEEGDPGSGIYVIRTGRVRIFSRNPEGPDEDLAILGPGDFFGETTLSAPTTRSASARAVETSELIGLFRADLLETIQKHPAIASKLLMGLTRVVSERLQAAAQEIRLLKNPSGVRGATTGS